MLFIKGYLHHIKVHLQVLGVLLHMQGGKSSVDESRHTSLSCKIAEG